MIKNLFVKAEALYKRGNGKEKFKYVCSHIQKKFLYMVPMFLIELVVNSVFKKNASFVNNLIIKEWIKL